VRTSVVPSWEDEADAEAAIADGLSTGTGGSGTGVGTKRPREPSIASTPAARRARYTWLAARLLRGCFCNFAYVRDAASEARERRLIADMVRFCERSDATGFWKMMRCCLLDTIVAVFQLAANRIDVGLKAMDRALSLQTLLQPERRAASACSRIRSLCGQMVAGRWPPVMGASPTLAADGSMRPPVVRLSPAQIAQCRELGVRASALLTPVDMFANDVSAFIQASGGNRASAVAPASHSSGGRGGGGGGGEATAALQRQPAPAQPPMAASRDRAGSMGGVSGALAGEVVPFELPLSTTPVSFRSHTPGLVLPGPGGSAGGRLERGTSAGSLGPLPFPLAEAVWPMVHGGAMPDGSGGMGAPLLPFQLFDALVQEHDRDLPSAV